MYVYTILRTAMRVDSLEERALNLAWPREDQDCLCATLSICSQLGPIYMYQKIVRVLLRHGGHAAIGWRFGRGCTTTWIWFVWSCVPGAATWEFRANCRKVYKFGSCSSTLANMWFVVDPKYGDLRSSKLAPCKHHTTSWMWDRHCVGIHCYRSCVRRKLVRSSVQGRASRTRRS